MTDRVLQISCPLSRLTDKMFDELESIFSDRVRTERRAAMGQMFETEHERRARKMPPRDCFELDVGDWSPDDYQETLDTLRSCERDIGEATEGAPTMLACLAAVDAALTEELERLKP